MFSRMRKADMIPRTPALGKSTAFVFCLVLMTTTILLEIAYFKWQNAEIEERSQMLTRKELFIEELRKQDLFTTLLHAMQNNVEGSRKKRDLKINEADSLRGILRLLSLDLEDKIESAQPKRKGNGKTAEDLRKSKLRKQFLKRQLFRLLNIRLEIKRVSNGHIVRFNSVKVLKEVDRKNNGSTVDRQELAKLQKQKLKSEDKKGTPKIKMDETSKPTIRIKIEGENKTAKSLNESLHCNMVNYLGLKIQTSIEGTDKTFQYVSSTRDILNGISVTLDHSVPCSCSEMVNDSFSHTGKESSKPSVLLSDMKIKADIGKPIKVVCNATGHPKPKLKWEKIGRETAVEQFLSNDKQSLTMRIDDPIMEDGGYYICSAESATGKDWKAVSLQFVERDCSSWKELGYKASGVYKISPDGELPFDVFCDMESIERVWTVIQRRKDGTVDFYKKWDEYKEGFGNIAGEFWLGNENIHRLTKRKDQMVRIELEDVKGRKTFAEYGSFYIDDESNKYALHVGKYSGSAGDSLMYHNGMRFSTKDNNNAMFGIKCAEWFRGAWWYRACLRSNLNGVYTNSTDLQYGAEGIKWMSLNNGHNAIIKTEIKIASSIY